MNQLEICLIISTLTIISYAWGKINMGTTAMLSMVAFVLTGCIDAKDALDNFANPNTVMMLSMFVVAAGFNRTKFVRICAHSVNSMWKKLTNKNYVWLHYNHSDIKPIYPKFYGSIWYNGSDANSKL